MSVKINIKANNPNWLKGIWFKDYDNYIYNTK